MKSVLEQPVLILNKMWQVLGTCTVRKAFEDLAAGAATALRFDEGYPTPFRWKDWIALPIQEDQDYVCASKDRHIPAPRVIIKVNYDKLIVKPPKYSKKALRDRDKNRCAYSGKVLKPKDMSVEHVIPVSKGGKTTFENTVLADRKINSMRGNRSLEEAGLKLLWKPTAPRARMPVEMIDKVHFPEWEMFLKGKNN